MEPRNHIAHSLVTSGIVLVVGGALVAAIGGIVLGDRLVFGRGGADVDTDVLKPALVALGVAIANFGVLLAIGGKLVDAVHESLRQQTRALVAERSTTAIGASTPESGSTDA